MVARGFLAVAFFAGLFLAAVASAQTENVEIKPGLNQLSVALPAGSDITWECRQPLTTQHLVFTTTDGDSVCAFYLAAGNAVFVSDLIDWDERRREKKTWIVSVTGDNPSPDPELDGIAGDVFAMAKSIGQPTISAAFAANYFQLASLVRSGGVANLGSGRDWIHDANREIDGEIDPRWRQVGELVGQYLTEHAQALPALSEAAEEIAKGLEAAAK